MLANVFGVLGEQLIAALAAQETPIVLSWAGPDRRDDHAAAPRVAWKPVSASHEAPRRTGGGGSDPGAILMRRWSIEVEVWGRTQEETERIVDLFLAVAHDELSQHSYDRGNETWFPGGATTDAVVCQIGFTLLAPVLRRQNPRRPITAINVSKKLAGQEV
jgi:hypothetical protein